MQACGNITGNVTGNLTNTWLFGQIDHLPGRGRLCNPQWMDIGKDGIGMFTGAMMSVRHMRSEASVQGLCSMITEILRFAQNDMG